MQFECGSMHQGCSGGRATTSGSEGFCAGQLLERVWGPYTVHIVTSWQQFALTLKLIWVGMHTLHSLCSAKIHNSGSFMWCEQIYLPTAVIGKYLFFAYPQFSWKLSSRETIGSLASSF